MSDWDICESDKEFLIDELGKSLTLTIDGTEHTVSAIIITGDTVWDRTGKKRKQIATNRFQFFLPSSATRRPNVYDKVSYGGKEWAITDINKFNENTGFCEIAAERSKTISGGGNHE